MASIKDVTQYNINNVTQYEIKHEEDTIFTIVGLEDLWVVFDSTNACIYTGSLIECFIWCTLEISKANA